MIFEKTNCSTWDSGGALWHNSGPDLYQYCSEGLGNYMSTLLGFCKSKVNDHVQKVVYWGADGVWYHWVTFKGCLTQPKQMLCLRSRQCYLDVVGVATVYRLYLWGSWEWLQSIVIKRRISGLGTSRSHLCLLQTLWCLYHALRHLTANFMSQPFLIWNHHLIKGWFIPWSSVFASNRGI